MLNSHQSLFFPTFVVLQTFSSSLGNLQSMNQLKQIGSKMPLEVFSKGLTADVNAAEEVLKAHLPKDIKMCDVTYPR